MSEQITTNGSNATAAIPSANGPSATGEDKQQADPQLGGADGDGTCPQCGRRLSGPGRRARTCADFEVGATDGAGHNIHEVYFKREKYVIYCTKDERTHDETDRQILVQYADKADDADKQIAEVANIIPLRNKAQSLIHKVKDKVPYYAQIAEALRLGLEHKPEIGTLVLQDAIKELENTLASDGRSIYVNKAWPLAITAAVVLTVAAAVFLGIQGVPFTKAWSPLAHLALACSGGALGALLSIAVSVRARKVAADGDAKSIRIDAMLRVLIGVSSAGILYLILGTGVLGELKIGDMLFKANAIAWQLALLIGFASGFLERLVPDMLEKTQKK